MSNFVNHLRTITRHKKMVMHYCFRIGLYRQGLLHDLSKYTPAEFIPGVIYFQGFRSPTDAERRDKGFSEAWLHHKGRNRHHQEYWTDYRPGTPKGSMRGVKVPLKYILEMFCDRIAASRIYNGENYNDAVPLEYFLRGVPHEMMDPETEAFLEKLLRMLAANGEEETFRYIRWYRRHHTTY